MSENDKNINNNKNINKENTNHNDEKNIVNNKVNNLNEKNTSDKDKVKDINNDNNTNKNVNDKNTISDNTNYNYPINPYESDPTTTISNYPNNPNDIYSSYNRDTLLRKAEYDYHDAEKNQVVTWLLWLFLSPLGAHRYYLGHIVYAIFMTITLGGFGIWALIDAFFIPSAIDKVNKQKRKEIYSHYGLTEYV